MEHYDTVVIGSGAGGLTAAAALARHGERVLVLEQHYLPGGWMQSFSLGGYRFSPGVHYVGECQSGGFLRRLYEGLGVSADLEMCEMNPDGYDHLLVGEERISVPRGQDRWLGRLMERFPHERRGLTEYFDVVTGLASDVARADSVLSFPRILALPLLAPRLVRWGLSTQQALLDKTIRDPLLRAFLTAQNGDHGLSPARASMPVHACTVSHYANGAYYPRGGAKSMTRAFIRAIRRGGGAIQLRAKVTQILLDGSRVRGVELASGERILAKNVVSNADPRVTYSQLLPFGACPKEQSKTRRMQYSASVVSVFAAVEMDLRGRGYDSGNYWYYRTADVARAYERAQEALPSDEVESLFLAIPTLKDPGRARRGHHTIEMFSFVPYAPFEPWRGTTQGQRGSDYEALKERLGDRVIAAAERVIPGISKAIVLRSVATPLTNGFYCEAPFGACYGTAKSPLQVGAFSFKTRSEIDGLHLCGASTLSHGVAGASISGLMAAQQILGIKSRDELLGPPDGSLRVFPAEHPEEWLLRAAQRPRAEEEPEPPSVVVRAARAPARAIREETRPRA